MYNCRVYSKSRYLYTIGPLGVHATELESQKKTVHTSGVKQQHCQNEAFVLASMGRTGQGTNGERMQWNAALKG